MGDTEARLRDAAQRLLDFLDTSGHPIVPSRLQYRLDELKGQLASALAASPEYAGWRTHAQAVRPARSTVEGSVATTVSFPRGMKASVTFRQCVRPPGGPATMGEPTFDNDDLHMASDRGIVSSGGAAGAPAPSDPPLPCPFDGGAPILESVEHAKGSEDRDWYYRCRSCACEGPWFKTPGMALRFWNTRSAVLPAEPSPADPTAWRADGYMRGSPEPSDLWRAFEALAERVGCPQCTNEYCGECDAAYQRMDRALRALRGSEPSAEAPTDRQLEHTLGYLREFIEYVPGTWGHPQREKAESSLNFLAARLRGGATDGALREAIDALAIWVAAAAQELETRCGLRQPFLRQAMAKVRALSGGSSSGGSPDT